MLAAALGAVVLVGWRLRAGHPAPLYPDGYQYLAMARGIAETGRPVLQLGPGGDLFAPNADAAAKPLYPALIALLHTAGVPLATAATWVSAVAAAAVVPAAGGLAYRLSGGLAGALVAVAVAVASPTLSFWAGFAGPDMLGVTLALAAAVALHAHRPAVGGVLAGLACASRPELALVAGAAAVAGLLHRRARPEAGRAATSGLVTVIAVFALVRPPLSPPSATLVAGGLVASAYAGIAASRAVGSGRWLAGTLAGPVALAVALLARAGGSDAWRSLAERDWPIAVVVMAAAAVALCRSGSRVSAALVVAAGVWLACVYLVKNPGSERYTAFLLPLLGVLAGIGAGSLPRRTSWAAMAVVVGACATTAITRPAPLVGPDMFPGVALGIEGLPPGVIVTAAPDAYGVLAAGRDIRRMRAGARGLVIVDAVAREQEPGLRARGRLVATIPTAIGYLRHDGRIDRAPARVIDGEVVPR